MSLFSTEQLDERHADVAKAKVKVAAKAKRRSPNTTTVINRQTGETTEIPGAPAPASPFAIVTSFMAAHPVATAAVTFGLMAVFGPARLVRVGLMAGRGIGMAMAAKKALQGVDAIS